jgi:GT2 family glycosyltransferase
LKPVVAICIPVYKDLPPVFFDCWTRLWKPRASPAFEGETHRFMTIGQTIEAARKVMTIDALNLTPRATHVLWLDSDMVFPPHALQRLLGHNVPIVGGLCHNRRPPYQPILGKKHADDERGFGWCYHYPPDALFDVDRTGAAFLLVERRVFEDVAEKFGMGEWWTPMYDRGYSEDFSFCARAQACGYRIVVDTGLEIGHLGEVVVDSAFARRNRPYEHEAWNPDPPAAEGVAQASIVIPTYNQNPKWLRAAVLSAAKQTVPVEVIVVDDGSVPPVPEHGWPSNVRVIYHEAYENKPGEPMFGAQFESARVPQNRGIANALNTGIEHMRTPWFAWLASDDWLDPRKVEMQLSALKQAGGVAGFTRYQSIMSPAGEFSEVAALPGWRNLDQQRAVLADGCAINGSTVMIHKKVFADVGGFDPGYRYGQDWELWCRIGQKYLWHAHEEILTTRREYGNLTSAIASSSETDERRLRRDAEDAAIRAKYKV